MDATPVRILGLAGSLRAGSLNRRLLVAAGGLAPARFEITLHPLGRVPLYDADLEAAGPPAAVARLREAIDAADGLLIATPEYNAGIPGVLKNAIDWASRPAFRSPLVGKPVALVGAVPGRGAARRALASLRTVLESTLARPLPDEVAIAAVHEKLHGDTLVDPATEEELRRLLDALERTVRESAAEPVDAGAAAVSAG